MALSKKPNPLPTALDYVPPNSVAVRITNKDSWWTLAEHPGAKNAGLSPLDLCFFNFGTRKPQEINWYLREKVGTRKTTADGLNYMFSNADTPGIVYVPAIGTIPDKKDYPPPPKAPEASDVWVGLGAKGGMMLPIAGIETMQSFVVSLDPSMRWAALLTSSKRLGLGVGASGGIALIIAVGFKSADDFAGYMQKDDWQWNAALGPNWGKLAKLKKLKPVIDFFDKIGAKTPGALKKLLSAHPDKWLELVKNGVTLKDSLGLKPGDQSIVVIDSPFGSGGTELSVFSAVSDVGLEASGQFGSQ